MSPENAEVVRAQLAAVNRRDVDALLSYCAPDVVYDTEPSGMGVYQGQEQVAAFLQGYWDLFDELRFEPEEVVDLDERVTLSVNRQDGRPAGSTASVRVREAHVIEWEAGTVTKVTVYTNIDEARSAAERLAQSRGGQAMAQENVELVLEGYARFNAGEREPSPDYWHEDGEYVVSRDDPDAQTHRGLEAVRRQFASWIDAYPDLRVEPLEAKGNRDKVFLWVRFVGHGAASGLPIQMELAHICTVRDGKTLRVEEYNDRAEALEAVGLAE